MNVITVQNLSKSFYLVPRARTLFKLLCSLKKTAPQNYILHVLKDISLEVRQGEKIGIIGLNGAGKTTLFRILSGIYQQDSGFIQVRGSFAAFFKMNLGAMPDLSLTDNIFLIGMVMGMEKEEIGDSLAAILSFAELERFAETPFKDLSNGMKERIFFSLMLVNKADILLLDEIVTVGDVRFQEKSTQAFQQVFNSEKTILINTHDLDFINRFCSQAVWLHEGKIFSIGKPEMVLNQYKCSERIL